MVTYTAVNLSIVTVPFHMGSLPRDVRGSFREAIDPSGHNKPMNQDRRRHGPSSYRKSLCRGEASVLGVLRFRPGVLQGACIASHSIPALVLIFVGTSA